MLATDFEQVNTSGIRICNYGPCCKSLDTLQMKFCSNACRNKAYVPGKSGGRPTQYRPEFSHEAVEDYLYQCFKADEPKFEKVGKKYKEIVEFDLFNLPSWDGFCVYIRKEFGMSVHRNTLTNWARAHQDFHIALERIKEAQYIFLVNNGLSKRYNSSITLLLLRNNHKGNRWDLFKIKPPQHSQY